MDRGITVSNTADVYSRQQTLRLGPAMQVFGTGVPQRTLVSCSQSKLSNRYGNCREQQARSDLQRLCLYLQGIDQLREMLVRMYRGRPDTVPSIIVEAAVQYDSMFLYLLAIHTRSRISLADALDI